MAREPKINFADLKDGCRQIQDTLKIDGRQMEKLVRKHADGLNGRQFQNFVENVMTDNNRTREK
jgi:hypothetical protein